MDKNLIKKHFAENLEDLIYKRQTTLTNVAKVTGIDVKLLSAYKNRRCVPPMDNIMKIARYFNVPDEYLISEHKTDSEKKTEIELIYQQLTEKDKQTLLLMARSLLLQPEYAIADKKESSKLA